MQVTELAEAGPDDEVIMGIRRARLTADASRTLAEKRTRTI